MRRHRPYKVTYVKRTHRTRCVCGEYIGKRRLDGRVLCDLCWYAWNSAKGKAYAPVRRARAKARYGRCWPKRKPEPSAKRSAYNKAYYARKRAAGFARLRVGNGKKRAWVRVSQGATP